ncbi:MAG: energy-coupling factor transporter transmembrane protein EcfT [Deferribacteraceae bacterium]|jgi:energy-coupling factor transport system permease protein|nr:energy-coupling factor transporter transmembrane protein EcfT [Deferribacteraceae bacterium]
MHKRFLGAYKDSGKAVCLLNPCVKFLFSLIFTLTAGLTYSTAVFFILAVILFSGGYTAGITPLPFIKALRPFITLLVFTFVIQLFITDGGYWAMPDFVSLGNAVFLTSRMALMIGFSALFVFITPPADIVRIFYYLFQPLRLIKISPADAALSMLIALRFIPMLFSEGEKIVDSQRLKGILPAKGEKQSGFKIVMSSLPLIVPLFVRTFHYAAQIGITLHYRRHGSRFLKLPRPVMADFVCGTLFIVTGVALTVAGNVF